MFVIREFHICYKVRRMEGDGHKEVGRKVLGEKNGKYLLGRSPSVTRSGKVKVFDIRKRVEGICCKGACVISVTRRRNRQVFVVRASISGVLWRKV